MKNSIVLRSLVLTLAVAGFSASSFGMAPASLATLTSKATVGAVTVNNVPSPHCDYTGCAMY